MANIANTRHMPSFVEVERAMKEKEYAVFTSGLYDVNLVGVRTANLARAVFNDWGYCFHFDATSWAGLQSIMTTDPGQAGRDKPMNRNGTALMCPGQYRGVYELGLHRSYKALRQCAPIKFWRAQPDLWEQMDSLDDPERLGLPVYEAVIGAHHHRALDNIRLEKIGRFSYGCQVWPEIWAYRYMIALAQAALDVRSFKKTSYTVLDERDFHFLGAQTGNRVMPLQFYST